MKWLINLISKVHMPYSVKKIDKAVIEDLKKDLKKGDIIFTSTFGYLINFFNVSPLNHCGVYDGHGMVYESVTKEGRIKTDLTYFLSRKDVAMIKRVNDQEAIPCFINMLEFYLGGKYDFDFEEGDDEFYCFEYVVICLKKAIKNIKIYPKKAFGRSIFLSTSFETTEFHTIYDSRNL